MRAALDRPAPVAQHRVGLLVATAVLAQASVSVVEMGVPTLVPFLKQSFELSVAGVGLLVACINWGRVLGSLPAGLLADRIGEPPVMVGACAGMAAFVSPSALASSAVGAGAALACLGAFAAAAAPAGSRFVLSAFGRRRRGLPMGLRQSAVPRGRGGSQLSRCRSWPIAGACRQRSSSPVGPA